jgi:hypothetical protein
MLLVFLVACGVESSEPAPDPDPALAPEPSLCPAQHEQCGVRDGGWNVRCDSGAVQSIDLNSEMYCAPGQTEVVCEVGIDPLPSTIRTCANGCADTATHYLETYDEYSRFDSASLCQ